MKKTIITIFLVLCTNSTFAYNIYLINDLPADSTNQTCNNILSFHYLNSNSSEFDGADFFKSYVNKPLAPGKRRLLARNRSPEVLELGHLLIFFPPEPFAFDTKCIGYASPRYNYLLIPELISYWYQGNTYPAIDTRAIQIGSEIYETVNVRLKVSQLPGSEFNQSHSVDVARIYYIIKRKSTTTDSVNITKGVLSNLRQRQFMT